MYAKLSALLLAIQMTSLNNGKHYAHLVVYEVLKMNCVYILLTLSLFQMCKSWMLSLCSKGDSNVTLLYCYKNVLKFSMYFFCISGHYTHKFTETQSLFQHFDSGLQFDKISNFSVFILVNI